MIEKEITFTTNKAQRKGLYYVYHKVWSHEMPPTYTFEPFLLAYIDYQDPNFTQ